jgi:hypothetical protein
VPFQNDSPHALLAIAADLLAQAEAQQRGATRLEQSVRQLSRDRGNRSGVMPPVAQIREQARAMRALIEIERVLLDELERELAGASG